MKIGILLTRLSAEKKKDELLNINSNIRPWLRNTSSELTIYRKHKKHTSSDISVGKYIEWKYKNITIDYIHPHEISLQRLKNNDINFMLIYDLLESFHVDSKKIFKNFENVLKTSKNVYPPYEYQKFINNKCLYINYLNKLKDNVIPTYCINKNSYNVRNIKSILDTIKKKSEDWGDKFIAKPIYGQESIGFKKFEKFNDKKLTQYIKEGMHKYPGLIFQKYIEDFDKKKPEVRVYFIDGKYKYSVITSGNVVSFPKSEKGYTDMKCLNIVVKKAKQTLNNLPKIKMNGKIMPNLLTRIDIATNKRGCGTLKEQIISEVEFVPSLYIEDISIIPEPILGDTMVKIAKIFKKTI